mgnify:CR=1 FL=1
MKKLFITVCAALVGLCAFAQKGDKAVGINVNYGTNARNASLGAKFRYGFTDHWRIEPSLTYYFGGSGMLDISANAHYVFHVHPKINVYPLAGIGFDLVRYETIDLGDWPDIDDWYYYSAPTTRQMDYFEPSFDTKHETESCFKFNFGVGAEYAFTDHIAAGLELRYEVITSGYSQFVVGIGSTYKF